METTISPADCRYIEELVKIAGQAVLHALWGYSPELDYLGIEAQCATERAVRAILYRDAGMEVPA